jgi:hypothetical protein
VERVYLTLSVPSLVVGGQVVSFLTAHEHNPIPSPVLLERRGLAFRRAVASFAEANDIPGAEFRGQAGQGRNSTSTGAQRCAGTIGLRRPGPTVWSGGRQRGYLLVREEDECPGSVAGGAAGGCPW